MFSSYFLGSHNQRMGTRAQKIPKHNAVTWGEALSPPHANVCDCDEYSLPMEKRYGGKETGACTSIQCYANSIQFYTNAQICIAPSAGGVKDGSQRKLLHFCFIKRPKLCTPNCRIKKDCKCTRVQSPVSRPLVMVCCITNNWYWGKKTPHISSVISSCELSFSHQFLSRGGNGQLPCSTGERGSLIHY